jgi:aminoglycoside 2'-N-acetyltransferase I
VRQLDVKLVSAQTMEEREALRALTTIVYPPAARAADPAQETIAWASPEWGIPVWDDAGALVGYVGIVAREATLDGRAVRVGGIGGVKTHPAARGQGHARAALGRAAAFMADELGAAFGLLVCREELLAFYGALGWRPFAGTMLVEQPDGRVPFTFNRAMVLPLREPAPLAGTLDLCGLPW